MTALNATLGITYLKILHSLILNLPLDRMRRSLSTSNAPPGWIVGLANYGNSNVRWGAMESNMSATGDACVLYIHHSSLQLSGFQRYAPITGSYGGGAEPYSVKLPVGTYLAEWIDPAGGWVLSSATFSVLTAGQTVALPATPSYSFDIALRITRR